MLKSEYVKDFYYTNMLILNGNDDLQPIDPNAEFLQRQMLQKRIRH